MDGSPTPKVPEAPYRAGVPLADIIPPDRRRAKAAALVVASMIAGIALWVLGGWAVEALRMASPIREAPRTAPITPGYVAGRLGPSVLHGPSGDFAMPLPVRSVVHVWLQGCGDCMPAFEAMAKLEADGGLRIGAPVVNVAYGEAEPTWARRYGVARNLVFDPGGANVVRPLGISTFTTLVVEPSGAIIHRDRPDHPGYAERVRNAVLTGNAGIAPPIDRGDPLAPPEPQPRGEEQLDAAAVQRVVAAHRQAIKNTCWERPGTVTSAASVSLTVTLSIGVDGRVDASSFNGDDQVVGKCISDQTKTWVFPPPSSATTVSIPFKFVRQ